MRMKKWTIESDRPEESAASPEEFYSAEEAYEYETSSAMHRMQTEMTLRALSLADFPAGAKILDLGCGTGISMRVLKERGYKPTGIDISEEMLKFARKKKFDVKPGDIRKMPFKKEEFDGAISISTLQWLLVGEDWEDEIKKAAGEARRVLKPGAPAVFQFYPKSEEIMEKTGKMFAKAGFGARFAIDNPDSPKKRKIFLILRRL